MGNLELFKEILDLCRDGQDYGEPWCELFGMPLENSTRPLTLNHIINCADRLGFKIIARFIDEDTEAIKNTEGIEPPGLGWDIKDFVEKFSFDADRNFFNNNDDNNDEQQRKGILIIQNNEASTENPSMIQYRFKG